MEEGRRTVARSLGRKREARVVVITVVVVALHRWVKSSGLDGQGEGGVADR